MTRSLFTLLLLAPQVSWAFSCADVEQLRNQGLSHEQIVKKAEAAGRKEAFVQSCPAVLLEEADDELSITFSRDVPMEAAPAEAAPARRSRGVRLPSVSMPKKRKSRSKTANYIPAPPPPPPPSPAYASAEPEPDTEKYDDHGVNGFVQTDADGQSTFSVDVDTASYAIARNKLATYHRMPPPEAVRVEEFVNAFDYTYTLPKSGPFDVHLESTPNPFQADRQLLRVGIQGRAVRGERKPVHLTFLVDVSGSMNSPMKLGLAQKALHHLVDNLGVEDTVAIATYAGRETIVLQPTYTTRKAQIHAAIDNLKSGGGTAMGSGMELAYQLAEKNFLPSCENRVIVLSDGDANIGRTSAASMLKSIEKYAEKGITMTTIGLGSGNYNDAMMEQLANKGDGNYFYLDSEKEARKVFGEDLSGTIETIARDVKIQVEFDPDIVQSYRLVGYENRDIADEDFRRDEVDAGEVGSGHQVTALYELELLPDAPDDGTLAKVMLRAKPPGPDQPAKEYSWTLPVSDVSTEFEEASVDTRLAWTVATFAEKLRGSPYAESVSWAQIERMAHDANQGTEEHLELIDLIERAGEYDTRAGVATK